ncbi:carbon-nitrogen hydrolase [Bacteroidetes/Chlorobi group bacterium Naka2016]|jgi:predicted amidohydrolase|nr:MAG: carbon-nitrogen hydrolase [Bacteroidetes/Chlorobi group bacterium Naka2016]
MKVAVVQFNPKFKDFEYNISFIHKQSKSIEADLICFPELATSGYFFWEKDELAPFAFDFNSSIIKEIQEISTSQNKIILFGFPERSGGNFYNSCAILFPDAKLSTVYRKTHLFYRERFIFAPGNTGFFVIHYEPMNFNLGTMICYDWRFPEAARSLGLLGADIIACPSNLVTKIWNLAIPARAIENKVFFLVANRIGKETNQGEELVFNGKSGIWHYYGSLIATANDNDETTLIAEIDPTETRDKSIDKYNNIFKDRRPEMYSKITEIT